MPIWSEERDPEWSELVTVLRTGDPALLSVAKSVLGDAGIRSLAKGEGVQDLFGLGRAGTGYNVLAGPVELQVLREDEEEARSLLARLCVDEDADECDLDDTTAPRYPEAPGEESDGVFITVRSAWWRRLVWLVPVTLGVVWTIGAVVRSNDSSNDNSSTSTIPALPPTAFGPQVGTAFYGRIWMEEGGTREYFPEVTSIRMVVRNDTLLLEDWTVETEEGRVHYPVYAFAGADSGWLLGIGTVREYVVTERDVGQIRRDLMADLRDGEPRLEE